MLKDIKKVQERIKLKKSKFQLLFVLVRKMMDSSDSEDERPPVMLEIPMVDPHERLYEARNVSPGMESRTPGTSIEAFLNSCEDLGKIGQGNNGSVHLYRKKQNGKMYAVKIMPIDEEVEKILKKNFFEVCTLKYSPNLVRYIKMFSSITTRKCYLVMKYYGFPGLDSHAGYPQEELKNIVSQILKGLRALHKKNFIHRDIKPDNILYDRENKSVVIVDLGVGRKVKTGQANTIAGTPAYRAPEMGVFGYSCTVDIYALGMTIYELVTGLVPFRKLGVMDHSDIKKQIAMKTTQSLDFNEPQWKHYSNRLQDLIKRMVKYLPEQRYDASKCLNHPWFINEISPDPQKNKNDEFKLGYDHKAFKSQAEKKSLFQFQENSYKTKTTSNGILNTNRVIEGIPYIDSDEEEYIEDG